MRILTFVSITLIGLVASGEDAGPPRTEYIQFDGHTFWLAFEGKNSGESMREYLPKGQRLDSWTNLAAIRKYPELNDPRSVARTLIRLLKQQHPDAACRVLESSDTGEVILDFVTWPVDGAYVEFNVFKYAKQEGGGLIAQQYAVREYENTAKFLRDLAPVRARLVKSMATSEFQIMYEPK